jgi:hypothetical protein
MTTYTLTKAAGPQNAMAGVGDGQDGKIQASTFTLTAALGTGDVIQSPLIQAGSVITDVVVVAGDLDTGTALTFTVGYGGNASYFITSSTIGQAGGVARMNAATALPLLLATNDTIDITITAGGAGGVGNSIALIVYYLPRNA